MTPFVSEQPSPPGDIRLASAVEPVAAKPPLNTGMPAEPASPNTGSGSVTIKVTDPNMSLPPGAASGTATTPVPGTPSLPTGGTNPAVQLLPPPGNETPITLHLDKTDIHKAFELVSRQANINIIVSPSVTGQVTGDLQNQPLNTVLEALTGLVSAVSRQRNGIIFITTLAEARRMEAMNMPNRIYRLNYVRAKDMLDMIKPLLSSDGNAKTAASPVSKTGLNLDTGATGQTGSIGSTGTINNSGADDLAGGESLIVTDYEDILKKVDAAIAKIDVQPVQVMIEAVLVQVKLTKNMDLGASFAVSDATGRAVGVVGSGSLINASTGFLPANIVSSTTGQVSSGFATDRYGLKYGMVGQNVSLFVKAIEGAGEARVLAAPRVWVLNKQSAQIHLGKMLGYQTTTTSTTNTTTTVNYLSVGTQLRIRPFVSEDGVIRMEVHPERSSGTIDDKGIPQTVITQVTTNVLMRSGSTMVIGGLIDNEHTQDWEGLPFLSRIPWLGYLFRHTTTSTAKTELIVIITPRICPPEQLDAFNFIGKPNALGLDCRVSQNCYAERRDGKSLYELLNTQTSCQSPTMPITAPTMTPGDASYTMPTATPCPTK